MKKALLITPLLLTGCLWDKDYSVNSQSVVTTEEINKPCFAIEQTPAHSELPPAMLINKCTGDTWIALKASNELKPGELTPSFSWQWMRVERYSVENTVAGIKSPTPPRQ